MEKQPLFRCPECGLHYLDKKLAERCQAWCKQYKSCNLTIARQSVEALQDQEHNKSSAL